MNYSAFSVRRAGAALFCAALLAIAFSGRAPVRAQQPPPTFSLPPYQSLTPVRLLGYIRRVYRLHRPPPAYETYTLVRAQNSNYSVAPGMPPVPDYANSYTRKYWVRNTDRAALYRQVDREETDGPLQFDRPALNQPRDPGPPTADLFEPAHPQPINVVPTPEPTNGPLKTIGAVVVVGESDYNVPKVTAEGDLLHLVLEPRRDPERNVLREIWVDKHTFVLRKIVAHDRLFVEGDDVYPVIFTYTLGYLDGYVVITHLDGIVEPIVRKERSGEINEKVYTGDGQKVTFDYEDITFPQSLPSWYFDPRSYAQHQAEAPE
ncbi:MAG TPA: hypothetical protein VFA29_05755 [Candidatus Baltobacteraceae bacterium]|nr:hypothetical protein [Candidatus Baltobacteraceae bacterium]